MESMAVEIELKVKSEKRPGVCTECEKPSDEVTIYGCNI